MKSNGNPLAGIQKRHSRFIVLEGGDRAGKTTQIEKLVERLKQQGYTKVWVTKEPTDEGKYGRMIRRILAGKAKMPEALEFQRMYIADRAEHQAAIAQHLHDGYIVICDRYYYSTLAYGVAVGLDFGVLWDENQHFIRPGLALYIESEPKTASQHDAHDRNAELQKQVRKEYQRLGTRSPGFPEIRRVNGNQPIDKVAAAVWREVSEFLNIKVALQAK